VSEITTNEVKEYLALIQGRETSLDDLRKEFNIVRGTKSFDLIRGIMFQLAEQRVVRPTGKRNGTYKVVTQVEPVRVFATERERIEPFDLHFPCDFNTKAQMSFANSIVTREGDLILISGLSNFGKTALCLNFLAENIDRNPILMGNEYTLLVSDKDKETNEIAKERYIPAPRFVSRLDAMTWVTWIDGDLQDRFTLLPVRDDYAEHIVRDKINIIDWINIDTGEHFMIGTILEGIKKQLGRGIAIIAIQKAEGAEAGRGGQFTKDFADVEILLDKFGEQDVLLKVGKIKEYKTSIIGKTYGYSIEEGVKILNFRELIKCPDCHGDGYQKGSPCSRCYGRKWVDK
jgi:hypothetical protein